MFRGEMSKMSCNYKMMTVTNHYTSFSSVIKRFSEKKNLVDSYNGTLN